MRHLYFYFFFLYYWVDKNFKGGWNILAKTAFFFSFFSFFFFLERNAGYWTKDYEYPKELQNDVKQLDLLFIFHVDI
jgi:hypothetical protein